MSQCWQVEVCEAEEGSVLRYVFAELPITIGRHEGNDVRLPRSFVSAHHARIERSSGQLAVLDVSRTNGIRVRREGGKDARLQHQQPEALSRCGNEFFIGSYRIQVHGAAATYGPASSAPLSAPALSLGSAGSVGLDSLLPSLPPSQGVERLADGARGGAAERRALEAAALEALEELAGVLVPGQQLDTPERVRELSRRLQLSLQLCCRGLVRLRKGQRRCASALRLPRPAPAGELGADSAEQLWRRLLDERLPLARLRGGLTAEFQALARHQVALLDGMIEGAAAVLQALSPEQVEARAAGRGASRWLPLGKLYALRRAYRQQHAQLSRRDGVLSVLFGRAFRDAYAAYASEPQRAEAGSARGLRKLG